MRAAVAVSAHESWLQLGPAREKHYETAKRIVLELADSWRRLVFAWSLPKFDLIDGCSRGDDDGGADDVLYTLMAKRTQCAGCVDPTFTSVWIDRIGTSEQVAR